MILELKENLRELRVLENISRNSAIRMLTVRKFLFHIYFLCCPFISCLLIIVGSLAHGIDVKKHDFDFKSGLSVFNKAEVLASVAANEDHKQSVYQKDDFFDSLSCEILDREEGRKTRMTAFEERSLNQDTFGATALQSSYRRLNGGRSGGRGRGRGRGNCGSRRHGCCSAGRGT